MTEADKLRQLEDSLWRAADTLEIAGSTPAHADVRSRPEGRLFRG
jgi:hypothetical protein